MKYLMYQFKILIKLPVYFYKFIISPLLPHVCRYSPTCSNYFIECVNQFGPFKGAMLGCRRILRCTPRNKCGYDPVPINIKGECKWLF